MGKTSLYRRLLICLALSLVLLSSGCLQLTEIRSFAATAGAVGDRFPALARDLYDSCMSQQRYIVAQRADFRVDKFVDLNDDNNPLMKDGRAQCQLYKDEQDRLIKANATLVSYMKTMGDLAADDLTNFDKNIEGFGKAATSAKLLTDVESTAITNLAKFLATIVAEGYRRKKLRDIIKQTNPDIQVITKALSRIVTNNYILQLENERVAMISYYRKLAREDVAFSQALAKHAQADPSVSNPAPLDDLKTKLEVKNASINVKVTGAQAYAKILDNVAQGHQVLNDKADKIGSREVLTAALSYAKTIAGLAADFQKAF